jgi:alpha-glucosidase
MKNSIIVLWAVIFSSTGVAQKVIQLYSPDKQLNCTVRTEKEGIKYQVAYNKTVLIEYSKLSLVFKDGFTLNHTIPLKPLYKDSIEEYDLVTGRTSHVKSHYKEVIIPMRDKNNSKRIINIIIRAFDDGIAFRYQIKNDDTTATFTITDEINEFRLAGNPKIKALILPDFTSSHEGLYTSATLNEIPSDTLMDMPALFSFPSVLTYLLPKLHCSIMPACISLKKTISFKVPSLRILLINQSK